MSPYSTTSLTWQRTAWPLKPDVVFEGGNLVKDQLAAYNYPSVSLLTTSHTPATRLFDLTRATSAASALAARMAAQISARYPVFWPETVRALMVHSAEWTDRMKHDFLGAGSKGDYERLVKPVASEYPIWGEHCGVPETR